mmetsp:Transcript_22710/g.35547  ORF Transcript_22710/g.35547 Transcript_22710/m.35547 type:complete len:143 (+) Transcript_22710:559-987(+)
MTFDTFGNFCASGGNDREVRVWELQPSTLGDLPMSDRRRRVMADKQGSTVWEHLSTAQGVAEDAQAKQAAAAFFADRHCVLSKSYALCGHNSGVQAVVVAMGRLLISAADDYEIRICDFDPQRMDQKQIRSGLESSGVQVAV